MLLHGHSRRTLYGIHLLILASETNYTSHSFAQSSLIPFLIRQQLVHAHYPRTSYIHRQNAAEEVFTECDFFPAKLIRNNQGLFEE